MIATLLTVAALAAAEEAPLYSGAATPWTLPAGRGTIGVFRPVSYGLGERVEVSTTGLLSLLAPRLELKHTALSSEHVGLGLRALVGVPTYGLRLSQGMLIKSNIEIPFTVVAGAGAVLGWRRGDWNLSLASTVRMAIPPTSMEPLDLGWGFDPMIAPVTEGHCWLNRLVLDWHPGEDWVLSAEAGVQLGGGPDWRGRLFALRRLGARTALGAGYWATYEKRTDDEYHPNTAPLADFQYRW